MYSLAITSLLLSDLSSSQEIGKLLEEVVGAADTFVVLSFEAVLGEGVAKRYRFRTHSNISTLDFGMGDN